MHAFPVAIRANRDPGRPRPKSIPPEENKEDTVDAPMPERAQPGIILLNGEGEILYLNREARATIDTRAGKNPTASASNNDSFDRVVFELYNLFKRKGAASFRRPERSDQLKARVYHHDGAVYLFRLTLLQPQGNVPGATQLLILIDRIQQTPSSRSDDAPIQLTPREKNVVQLLSKGMTNKEVANCMRIAEYTVKGHIKQIMKKFHVTTRSGIVAKSFSNRPPLNSVNREGALNF
ncbi:MAG: helix-turn-helix transcriptional regulator [Nitrospirae bacterium]|nr:helix-turn-helix transcriptional regulator [Candidatus Manganitrophaceae bacterium]